MCTVYLYVCNNITMFIKKVLLNIISPLVTPEQVMEDPFIRLQNRCDDLNVKVRFKKHLVGNLWEASLMIDGTVLMTERHEKLKVAQRILAENAIAQLETNQVSRRGVDDQGLSKGKENDKDLQHVMKGCGHDGISHPRKYRSMEVSKQDEDNKNHGHVKVSEQKEDGHSYSHHAAGRQGQEKKMQLIFAENVITQSETKETSRIAVGQQGPNKGKEDEKKLRNVLEGHVHEDVLEGKERQHDNCPSTTILSFDKDSHNHQFAEIPEGKEYNHGHGCYEAGLPGEQKMVQGSLADSDIAQLGMEQTATGALEQQGLNKVKEDEKKLQNMVEGYGHEDVLGGQERHHHNSASTEVLKVDEHNENMGHAEKNSERKEDEHSHGHCVAGLRGEEYMVQGTPADNAIAELRREHVSTKAFEQQGLNKGKEDGKKLQNMVEGHDHEDVSEGQEQHHHNGVSTKVLKVDKDNENIGHVGISEGKEDDHCQGHCVAALQGEEKMARWILAGNTIAQVENKQTSREAVYQQELNKGDKNKQQNVMEGCGREGILEFKEKLHQKCGNIEVLKIDDDNQNHVHAQLSEGKEDDHSHGHHEAALQGEETIAGNAFAQLEMEGTCRKAVDQQGPDKGEEEEEQLQNIMECHDHEDGLEGKEEHHDNHVSTEVFKINKDNQGNEYAEISEQKEDDHNYGHHEAGLQGEEAGHSHTAIEVLEGEGDAEHDVSEDEKVRRLVMIKLVSLENIAFLC
ncbi:hypothetical protein CBR_g24198 [Chara braunii]|uniref:Uncharacterized protein n=1 Tax=Chara braunii TaxID=69332 RepID=A0A388L615_CHABU|nr:hypothetical protein CBR_g24198 [Chara braunii]|eukprot:GBG77751.1 hypothetical protein CBR_g24198 [Chara braunii]